MDDLELIKLAGKAADIEYTPENNPLNDDALALRLAVKLGLGIRFYLDGVGVGEEYEMNQEDPYAATRRCIVRAAAAIGESLDGNKNSRP